jgi:type 1 glutamine amidotransferase
MRHPLLAVIGVCAAALLLSAVTSPAAEPLATITVEAGDHDRIDTPVSVPLQNLGGNVSAGVLQETRDGRQVPVPYQVEAGPPARLWFILEGKTPAAMKRMLTVLPAAAADPQTPVVAVTEAKGRVDISLRGKPVLHYHKAQTKPPEGVGKEFAHEAYIHPARTPAGRIVTDDYPPDHKHQRGIWFSWTKTEFHGRHPDFWNLGKGTAYTRFAGLAGTASGPVFGRFDARHEHLDMKAPGGPVVMLTEDWTVRVWNTGGKDIPWYLWDLVSRQRCATDTPVRLPKYYYGGLGYRGNREWLKQVAMNTSEGKGRADGNASKARWLDVSGPLDGGRAGCLILIHPENFRYPQPLRLNPKQPQICVAPSQEGDWEIKPGMEYVSRYRFVIHDGETDDKTAERLWRDFAEPPKVTVAKPAGAAGESGDAGPAKPLRICMISGAKEYEANESCAFFKEFLEKRYHVTCTHVQGTDGAKSLPGIEALKEADLLFVFCRRTKPQEDQLRLVQEWCKAGKPVVGVRTASHAFQEWLEFDKTVLGGNYKGHYGKGTAAQVRFAEAAKDHPVLKGVKPFASPYSLYKNTGLAEDVTLLATATAGDKTEPVAWTRVHKSGRVFYTSLGGPRDFRDADFRRMLTNAVFWAAGREPPKK